MRTMSVRVVRRRLAVAGWTLVVASLAACGNGFYRTWINKSDAVNYAPTGSFYVSYVPDWGKPPIAPEIPKRAIDSLAHVEVAQEARAEYMFREDLRLATSAGDQAFDALRPNTMLLFRSEPLPRDSVRFQIDAQATPSGVVARRPIRR